MPVRRVSDIDTLSASKESPRVVTPQYYENLRFFGIPFNALGLAHLASTTVRVQLSTSYAFVWTATVHEPLPANGLYLVSIKDEFLTEDIFLNPVPASTIAGTGQLPFKIQEAIGIRHVFRAGSGIAVTFENRSGATADIRFILLGYKDVSALYPRNPLETR